MEKEFLEGVTYYKESFVRLDNHVIKILKDNHTLGNLPKDQQTGIGRVISDSKGMLRLEQTNEAKK